MYFLIKIHCNYLQDKSPQLKVIIKCLKTLSLCGTIIVGVLGDISLTS